jgi:hypothetical protein
MTNKPDGGERRVDSQEFYELMQRYRHMPIIEQAATTEAFEAVKNWVESARHEAAAEMLEGLAHHFDLIANVQSNPKIHGQALGVAEMIRRAKVGPPEVQAAMEARDERIRQETISAHHHDIMEAAQSPITEDERKQIEQQAAANALEAAARDLGELADKYESGSYGEHYLKMAISNIRDIAPDIAAKAKEHDSKIEAKAYLRCAEFADRFMGSGTVFRKWANEADGGGK